MGKEIVKKIIQPLSIGDRQAIPFKWDLSSERKLPSEEGMNWNYALYRAAPISSILVNWNKSQE